jgi:hypothetical protein
MQYTFNMRHAAKYKTTVVAAESRAAGFVRKAGLSFLNGVSKVQIGEASCSSETALDVV